jgi:rod shape-determining protein MreD
MRRFFIVFPLLAVLSLVQGMLGGVAVVGGIHLVPDLSLVFLVMFSVEFGRGVGMSAGWMAGLLEDFALAQLLGLQAMVKMLTGSIFGALRGRFKVGALLIALITVAGATVLKYGLTWAISRLFGLEVYSLVLMLLNLAVEMLLNLAITLPAFWVMRKILRASVGFIRREQKI